MSDRNAKANIVPVRQTTQFNCMSTSLQMAMSAFGRDFPQDHVARVMGVEPKRGASWEQFMAAAQILGFRTVTICPGSIEMLSYYTDQGIPVVISWNPESRPWAHASTVYDVTNENGTEQVSDRGGKTDLRVVWVADPNNPDPVEFIRKVPAGEFYKKWVEQWSDDTLVRHVMVAVFPEVTDEGAPGAVHVPSPEIKKARVDRIIEAGKRERQKSKDRSRSMKMTQKGAPDEAQQRHKRRIKLRMPTMPRGQTIPSGKDKERRRHPKHRGRGYYAGIASRAVVRFNEDCDE